MSVLGHLILLYGRDDASDRVPGTSYGLQQGMVKLIDASRTEVRCSRSISSGDWPGCLASRNRPPASSPAWTTTPSPCEPPRLRPSFRTPSGPERLLPVALRRLPGEGPLAANALTHIFWSFRFPPSCVPMLTAALTSDHWVVRVCRAPSALNHMGLNASPAQDEVMALLRRELDHPRPRPSRCDWWTGPTPHSWRNRAPTG